MGFGRLDASCPLAQLAERLTLTQKVLGSIPRGAIPSAAVTSVNGGVCVFAGPMDGIPGSVPRIPRQALVEGSSDALETRGKSPGARIERMDRSTSSCGQ